MRTIPNRYSLSLNQASYAPRYQILKFLFLEGILMNNSAKSITNSIANITTINNQTAVIIATTISSAENTFTSLGGAMGSVTNSEDLNHLLNEATTHSYQNLQNQTPNLPGVNIVKNIEIAASSSIHQPAPNIPSEPVSKPSVQKQPYTKTHSTTLPASQKQQELIKSLSNETSKNLYEILAPYNKSLSEITSAEANQIIQSMKKHNNNQVK